MIDWSKAPEWANWHAFDVDGGGRWLTSKPIASTYNWKVRRPDDMNLGHDITLRLLINQIGGKNL